MRPRMRTLVRLWKEHRGLISILRYDICRTGPEAHHPSPHFTRCHNRGYDVAILTIMRECQI